MFWNVKLASSSFDLLTSSIFLKSSWSALVISLICDFCLAYTMFCLWSSTLLTVIRSLIERERSGSLKSSGGAPAMSSVRDWMTSVLS